MGTVGLQSLRSGILILHCLDAVWQPSGSGGGAGGEGTCPSSAQSAAMATVSPASP